MGLSSGPVDQSQQLFERNTTHRAYWLAHRGQWRIDKFCKRHVVEADQRQIMGHVQPRPPCTLQNAYGDKI